MSERLLALTLASWFMFSGAQSAGAQSNPPVSAGEPARGDAAIYVARRGWHIDVGFAASELTPPLSGLAANFPGARYLFFGFGDRRYLMAKDRRSPSMLAALWPGKALILVTGLVGTPAEAFGGAHAVRLRIAAEQSLAAQEYIWRSLESTASPTGDPLRMVERGPYDGSLYFAARPRYSALHTCNTWAAEVLRKAGLPVRTRGVLFVGQLWRQTERLASAEQPGANSPQAFAP
jgi:hypothetical protein